MKRENQRSMSKFPLLGLSIWPEQQCMYLVLFLGMYLTTVLGDLLIRLNPHLHTPMYFFLSQLTLTDIQSLTVPKMVKNMQTQDLSISYPEFISQVYFYMLFIVSIISPSL